MTNDQRVMEWIKKGPGMVESDCPQRCMLQAYGKSGLAAYMPLAEFEAIIKSRGFLVQPVRSNLYRLALPSRAASGYS